MTSPFQKKGHSDFFQKSDITQMLMVILITWLSGRREYRPIELDRSSGKACYHTLDKAVALLLEKITIS